MGKALMASFGGLLVGGLAAFAMAYAFTYLPTVGMLGEAKAMTAAQDVFWPTACVVSAVASAVLAALAITTRPKYPAAD